METILEAVVVGAAFGVKHFREAKSKINPSLHSKQLILFMQLMQLLIQASQRLVALLAKVPVSHLMHKDPTVIDKESQIHVPFTEI